MAKKKNTVQPSITERGEQLERINTRRYNSNVMHGTAITVEHNGDETTVKVGQTCPKCKFRIRGVNHANGAHHQGNVAKHKRR